MVFRILVETVVGRGDMVRATANGQEFSGQIVEIERGVTDGPEADYFVLEDRARSRSSA